MKLEHFGMAEPGDCRLVFTAGAEELAAAVAQVQAEPDETAMSFMAIIRLSPSMNAKLTLRLCGERCSMLPLR